MTKEEAIKVLTDYDGYFIGHSSDEVNEALDMAISALKGGEWTPVNDIEDIPKSGSYWVTKDYKFGAVVEKIRWSTVWRCWEDNDTDEVLIKESASLITAYMPYTEPEPYKKEVSE